MLRLDYISCCLTILSTVLVGRRLWQGWIVAGVNSGIICLIALDTKQTGLVPANLFCIALYAYNLWNWRPIGLRRAQDLAENASGRLCRTRPAMQKQRHSNERKCHNAGRSIRTAD